MLDFTIVALLELVVVVGGHRGATLLLEVMVELFRVPKEQLVVVARNCNWRSERESCCGRKEREMSLHRQRLIFAIIRCHYECRRTLLVLADRTY